ncbi:TldD/PmbA family protein [Candidatus Woesearchaeota archaeon]|nr:TldD/PmbA family protein [Candidatus Woesearchaeota archaeon]
MKDDLDADIAEFAVEKAREAGASFAEARMVSTEGSNFLLKNGNLEISEFNKVSGLGLRFIKDGAMGFLSSNVLSRDNLSRMIRRTLATISKSRINERVPFAEGKAVVDRYTVPQKRNLLDVDPAEKTGLLFEIEKFLASGTAKVPGRYLSLGDSVQEKLLLNSEGTRIESVTPRASFFYFLTIAHGDTSVQRYWQHGNAGGWEFVEGWGLPQKMAEEASALDRNAREGAAAPTGKLDVVCGPEVVGIMVHESVGHPYEGDRILGREAAQAGESFVKRGMLNTRIGSDVVDVSDDPRIEHSFAYYKYDDEGVPAVEKRLITKGMIREFLHNRSTAAALGTVSNAASRATDYDREAIVRMSNTFLKPGDHSEQELIEGITRGVYIKNFTEWNIDDRRLNQKYVGAECFLIENGRLTRPVIAPVIEIDTPTLWGSVDAVADNIEYHAGTCGKGEPMQGIPVWFGGPSMRLRNITFGGGTGG